VTYGIYRHLRGQRVRIGECLAVGYRHLFPVLGINLLAMLAVIVLMVLAATLALWVGAIAYPLVFVPVAILSVVPYFMWWVAVPAIVTESISVREGLRRSAQLTAGNRVRIFVGFVLMVLAHWLIRVGLDLLFGNTERLTMAETRIYLVTVLAVSIVTSLASAVVNAVVYYEPRIVNEGVAIDDLKCAF